MTAKERNFARNRLPDGDKKLLRQVVRQVHPDLFSADPAARAQNSASLQALNAYVSELGQRGGNRKAVSLCFYAPGAHELRQISAELPRHGSLGPLFLAFGLISAEELEAGAGLIAEGDSDNRNFLSWLEETVAEAASASLNHRNMHGQIQQLCSSLEQQYGFSAVLVDSEYATSPALQQRQLEALQTFADYLQNHHKSSPAEASDASGGGTDEQQLLQGLQVMVHNPDDAEMRLSDDPDMQSYIAEDGCLHLECDADKLPRTMSKLDLEEAGRLQRLHNYWLDRASMLMAELCKVLRMERVLYDPQHHQNAQEFVLWAGNILENRKELLSQLASHDVFRFSLLLHFDEDSPVLEFVESTCILQAHVSCTWEQLLQHLLSQTAADADSAAAESAEGRASLAAALREAEVALGASQVISVCSEADRSQVIGAARRLCGNADAIRNALNLSGVSLAIDDCYEAAS
ncbi:hypothetical protein WJX73_008286 [Symbiochloris irregularis]|uniref:DUF4460 domain-containing protein n=1 Tax=Symbiochloris irregularis TaxID=706552 RepID=A0AAW1NMW8_9CHLO